jgi:hypothetical protein
MRSQIFAGLALGVVAMVSGAPVESSASSEPVSITAATFIRRDGNQNGNWDTITHLGFGLETPVTTVHCEGNTFPDPAIPSNVYACDDPAYSFQITDRPGYSLYAITVTHKVSDRYVSRLFSI